MGWLRLLPADARALHHPCTEGRRYVGLAAKPGSANPTNVHAPPKPNTYIIGIVLGILFPVLFILLGLCYFKNRCSPLGRWQRHDYDAAMQAEAQACAHEAANNPMGPGPMALVPTAQPMAPMASGCPVPIIPTAVPFHPPVQHCQPMMCPGGVTVCPPLCPPPPPCPPPVPYNVYTQYSVPVAPVIPVAPVAPAMPAHSAQPWMHSHVAHTEYNPHETLGEAWLRRRRSVSPERSGRRPSRPKHSSSTSSSS